MIRDNPVIKELLSLDLPVKHYAIFGSGIMLALGIKKLDHDIDIISRGPAWRRAQKFGKIEKAEWSGKEKIVLFNGDIEIFNDWVGEGWDVNNLIESSEFMEGIPFVDLNTVLKWKKEMGRKKDLKHIKMIEEYIGKNSVSRIYNKSD